MRKSNIEILKLTSKEVLLSLFDLSLPFFEASNVYRVSAYKYKKARFYERQKFSQRIKYLKNQGLISSFVENKELFYEITPSGIKRIKTLRIEDLSIERPNNWDKKWRVIIFDIPEKHRVSRNFIREKLRLMNFQKIQESVYVYPFECTVEITRLSDFVSEKGNILIMISEIIQGEERLVSKFIELGVLNKKDLM